MKDIQEQEQQAWNAMQEAGKRADAAITAARVARMESYHVPASERDEDGISELFAIASIAESERKRSRVVYQTIRGEQYRRNVLELRGENYPHTMLYAASFIPCAATLARLV